MSKPHNIKKELISVREEVMVCFQNVLCDKQFQAQMLLGLVGFHLIAKRIQSSRDLETRRNLLGEFKRYKKAIAKNLALLKQSMQRNQKTDRLPFGAQTKSAQSNFSAHKQVQKCAGRGP